jgi:HupE / UreJ protein
VGRQYTLRGMVNVRRSCVVALLTAAILLGRQWRPTAHDIPSDVTVQAFLKPDGQRLHLLVRAPLGAMRDVQFPLRGPGNLDLARADRALRDAATIWISDAIAIYEDDARLVGPRLVETRVSLPSDRSFASYETALAHVTGPPLPDTTELIWNQGMLDALFEYPIRSERSTFSIHPGLARLGIRVVTVLRFLSPSGTIRAFEYIGDPGLVRLDPRWHQAAWQFVKLGFFHILDGTDHLLFLLCLVIPFRRLRPLILVVTAFTVAHSITLIASALDLAPNALWFPPLIETLIALSIVYMALENILLAARPSPGGADVLHIQRRWMIAFAFGLVHGFGFSFVLRETLQFGGSHLLASLLSFNLGVELGQVVVLLVLVPLLQLLFRFVIDERVGTLILSAFVAHTAWHWTLDRGEQLRRFAWPSLDPATMVVVLRWLTGAVVVAALIWLAGVLRHAAPGERRSQKSTPRM